MAYIMAGMLAAGSGCLDLRCASSAGPLCVAPQMGTPLHGQRGSRAGPARRQRKIEWQSSRSHYVWPRIGSLRLEKLGSEYRTIAFIGLPQALRPQNRFDLLAAGSAEPIAREPLGCPTRTLKLLDFSLR